MGIEYLPPFEHPEQPRLDLEFFVAWLPDIESQIPVTPTIKRPEEEV